MHMETIGRINQDALSWLEAIPFEKWALSHDGGRRYGIMTTNISEVFNSVLKGARSEQYTPYVDAKINANVVKAGSHEVVFTWAPLFNPIHNEYEWPPYVGPVIVPADSMKRVSGGRPKSTRLHNEMDVREEFCPADIQPSPDVSHPEFCPTDVQPSPDVSHPEFYPADVPPSLDVSHPEFCPADVPPSPDISYPEFCPADVPPSLDISHPESCPADVQPSPDVSHLEFCPIDVPPSPNVSHPEFCPADVPPSPDISHLEFCPADVQPSLDISHPEFCPADVPPSPDISHPALDAGWERRAIQLPRSDISGSSNSACPESIRSRQFRFPGQLGSSNTRDSPDPFSPTIKRQTPIILTTKSPELSLIFNAI
ncbi:hypothetical protein CK203_103396 [Vitis vinifera]|uniref:Uncharacterized protein n=1 Tax=Vitis vinifera TaxID=29760 RepID=A0A438EJ43_VITVI|nr:hypothetical protein CK203_103396 [Vitis vinifera]